MNQSKSMGLFVNSFQLYAVNPARLLMLFQNCGTCLCVIRYKKSETNYA